MTVLVGILCEDGAIIGADSAATTSDGTRRFSEQETRKIDIVDDYVIVAGTGQVGLHQRFLKVVENLYAKKIFSGKDQVEISKEICREAITDFRYTHLGQVEYGALVAFPCENKPALIEFDSGGTFQPEYKGYGSLWYGSMGSGQPFADPFLGLMRRSFFPDAPPKLSTGTFVTSWTLEHVVEVNTGGIKGPCSMAVLRRDDKAKLRATYLCEEELMEHQANVSAVEEYLAAFPDTLTADDAPELPSPPE